MFEYEFRRGSNAPKKARNIKAAYGKEIAKNQTVRFLF